MDRVRTGNVKLLGELFERHSANLYGFFVRHTNKRDASEDLVQDVFLRILKYRQTFRGDAPFTVWMYQLARNASNDHFKKWNRETPAESFPEDIQDQSELPNDLLHMSEQSRFVQMALQRIGPEKREVLLLSRFQELKYEEIGKILQCPVGTVKARVHFALQELRKEYFKLTGEKTI